MRNNGTRDEHSCSRLEHEMMERFHHLLLVTYMLYKYDDVIALKNS